MTTHFDVIIIGAGSAGLAAAREVRKHTERFLLINDGPYGTTCARVGCMPSKALIEAANAYHARNKAEAFGIRGSEHLRVDVAAVFQRVRALRDRFVKGVLNTTDAMGESSIAGRARLLGPRRVAVGNDIFETRSVIIATGSRPILPPAWQALGERVLTTETFFEQKTLPGRMAVIGLGAIGIEMAQAMSRLDVEVHAFGKDERIAGISDPAIAKVMREALEDEFSIYTGNNVELSATAGGVRVQAGSVDIEVDRVLVAVGRKSNIDNLGIETLGVSLDKQGLPPFDRNSLQIADLPVFIAGDVNAYASLLHEAADEGYIAGVNALASEPTRFCRRTSLAIVFSDPGIALVGQRFSDIDEAQCLVGSVDYSTQGRALTAQRNRGLMHIYACAENGRLLGAEICGPAAEHISHLLALAVERQLTVHDLLAMPFYHPVLEEGLRTALREVAGKLPNNPPDLSACNPFQTEALD